MSGDGNLVATAGMMDGRVKLWEVEAGRLAATIESHAGLVVDMAFSPDGALIATASRNGPTQVWDARSGQLLATLLSRLSRTGNPGLLAFSSDSAFLVSADDGATTVESWDVSPETRSPEEIAKLVECYVPWRFDEGHLVPATPDPSLCQDGSTHR